MKPILFMQQLLAGSIRVYRDKNIYWVSSVDEPEKEILSVADSADEAGGKAVLDKCEMSFYEKAFSNIRAQLSGSGLENDLADEIADVCVRANTSDEPRKVIHNLLCQHFGQKAGAQFYRKAVKYLQYVS